jgi:hypothetical protein
MYAKRPADTPSPSWSPSRPERDETRDRDDLAHYFIGGEEAGDGRSAPRVLPMTGTTFILVPPWNPELPWRDSRTRIGQCRVHDQANDVRLEEDLCPFRVTSNLASSKPKQLHYALYHEWLAARPELPRDLVWRSVREWQILRIRLNGVRVASMTGRDAERFLPGGEPMLRHTDSTWGYLRWAHTREMAAIALVETDPAGPRLANRLLFFTHAAEALYRAGAIELDPLAVTPRFLPRPGERSADGRLLLPLQVLPPAHRRSTGQRLYEKLVRLRASVRRQAAIHKARRRIRWTAVKEFLARELALREEDATERFRVRMLLITTLKLAFGGSKPTRRLAWALGSLAMTALVVALHFVLPKFL